MANDESSTGEKDLIEGKMVDGMTSNIDTAHSYVVVVVVVVHLSIGRLDPAQHPQPGPSVSFNSGK